MSCRTTSAIDVQARIEQTVTNVLFSCESVLKGDKSGNMGGIRFGACIAACVMIARRLFAYTSEANTEAFFG
jgi:hypothetical protein